MAEYKVFISHSHGQDQYYEGVRSFLKERLGKNFRDKSIDLSHRVQGNWQRIAEAKIDDCDVVVVINKPSATHSEAITKELKYAKKRRKPILAVVPREGDRRSSVVQELADDHCDWDSQHIADAVKTLALNSSSSGGFWSKLIGG